MAERLSRDERVTDLLRLFEQTGLKFRLVLIDDGVERLLGDTFGETGPADMTTDSWPVSEELEIHATLGETGDSATRQLHDLMKWLVPQTLRMERELQFFSRELASRYGEVDLLTSIGETLGTGLLLDRGVARLLSELVGVMNASGAELWVAGEAPPRLTLFAASDGRRAGESLDLEISRGPLAEVLSSRASQSVRADGRSELLVPVTPSRDQGLSDATGVVRVFRDEERPFRQSDLRLVSAVASQVGAAFENRRLTDEGVERERMMVELELAHHLQLKLLPELADFADCADIAARCEPADSVGGDFYHLFRLGEGRIGVMLGDVSSHGYSAGLIMALTMSAASLVVRESDRPADVLRGIHHELVRKLESTDMYMTLCYLVLDPARNRLQYANAGHPHAFRIGPVVADRLEALNPPLGIAEFDAYEERQLSWYPGKDTLLLFTDGLSETMRADRIWSDDLILEAVRRHADEDSAALLEELFRIATPAEPQLADDRTALVLK